MALAPVQQAVMAALEKKPMTRRGILGEIPNVTEPAIKAALARLSVLRRVCFSGRAVGGALIYARTDSTCPTCGHVMSKEAS
jgi:formamidopyrimidine-DNA glycosylase